MIDEPPNLLALPQRLPQPTGYSLADLKLLHGATLQLWANVRRDAIRRWLREWAAAGLVGPDGRLVAGARWVESALSQLERRPEWRVAVEWFHELLEAERLANALE